MTIIIEANMFLVQIIASTLQLFISSEDQQLQDNT